LSNLFKKAQRLEEIRLEKRVQHLTAQRAKLLKDLKNAQQQSPQQLQE